MKVSAVRFLVLIGLLAGGCGPASFTPNNWSGFLEGRPEEREQVIKITREKASGIRNLRLYAAGSVRRGLASDSFREIILFDRPDRIRLEFLATAARKLISFIVARDGLIQAYDAKNEVVYTGEVREASLERLLGVPFTLDEFMLWYAGCFDVPSSDKATISPLYLSQDRAEAGLRITYQNGRQVFLTVDYRVPSLGRINRIEIRAADSSTKLAAEFSYPSPNEKQELPKFFPTSVSFRMPDRGIRGKLDYEKIQVNPGFNDGSLFWFDIPDGVTVAPLDKADDPEISVAPSN